MKNLVKIPQPPKPPLSRYIREGSFGTCAKCHSSEIRKKILGLRIGKKMGCIQPDCENYYKNNN